MARQSKREEIVDAAVDQFHAHGYNATGVKDITDAAGVPKGSFYNHFDSKEALAAVALQRYADRLHLTELADTAMEPLARLRAHFEFLRSVIEEYGYARGCMFGNFGAEAADHSETIRGRVRLGFHEWEAVIAAVLAEAQASGTVRAGLDPATTARFMLNAWEGTLIRARVDRAADAFDTFFTVAFDALLTR